MSKSKPSKFEHILMVCNGSDCRKLGAKGLVRAARRCAKDEGKRRSTKLIRTQCTGLCKQAPIVCLQPSNEWLTKATEEKTVAALRASYAN